MRRVYFSFDYSRDLHRVMPFGDMQQILARSPGGFKSSTVWQEARNRGDSALAGLINDAMMNTSVTVICLGQRSAFSKTMKYEISRSLKEGKGLVGIKINHLRDQDGTVDAEAPVPPAIEAAGYKVYKYTDNKALAEHIEEAAKIAEGLAAGQAPAAAPMAAGGGGSVVGPDRRKGQRRGDGDRRRS